MHEGVTGFLGGRLTFADLGKPKRILEVGLVILEASCHPRSLREASDQGGKRSLGGARCKGLP